MLDEQGQPIGEHTVRVVRVQLNAQGDAALRAIGAATGDNPSTVVHRALMRYAALRGMADENGELTVTSPVDGATITFTNLND